MKATELFSLPDHFPFYRHFPTDVSPWEWIPLIQFALETIDFQKISLPDIPPGIHIQGEVFIDPTVQLPPYATIEGPAWIGAGTEIRPGAYIRGNVIVGKRCVLGNACEYKNCLLMDEVQTPHYNYVGDSILGNQAHLGAGVICANLRIDQKPVSVTTPDGLCETGLRKLGALLGDGAEVGCNTSLQPGALLGKKAIVGPVLAFGGYLKPNTMAFGKTNLRHLPRLS